MARIKLECPDCGTVYDVESPYWDYPDGAHILGNDNCGCIAECAYDDCSNEVFIPENGKICAECLAKEEQQWRGGVR